MGKRISQKVVVEVTPEQYEDAMSRYANADAREQQIQARMDEAFTKVRAAHQEELADLAERKKETFVTIKSFCVQNKKQLFAKRRSYNTLHGIVGFRLGTPKLKTLKGFTWDRVLEKLKATLPDYVRTTEEPAKDMLLADRQKEGVAEYLEEIGVEVVQEEVFFIDLKKEEAA